MTTAPRYSRSIEINAHPDRVWSVMEDAERWHEWTPSVKYIKRLDPGPWRVGSRAVIRQPWFPPALWVIVEHEPGHSFTWVSKAPGIRVYAKHFVEAQEKGTRATLSLRFDGWLTGLLIWLTDGINKRYLEMEATGLKMRSEGLG